MAGKKKTLKSGKKLNSSKTTLAGVKVTRASK